MKYFRDTVNNNIYNLNFNLSLQNLLKTYKNTYLSFLTKKTINHNKELFIQSGNYLFIHH